jgi:hypothetical protein
VVVLVIDSPYAKKERGTHKEKKEQSNVASDPKVIDIRRREKVLQWTTPKKSCKTPHSQEEKKIRDTIVILNMAFDT